MDTSDNSCIYNCEASMYVDAVKKWAYGKFYVSLHGIYFECNKDSVSLTKFVGMSIDYDEMSCIMKEMSSFIFPSITIYVGQTKYWFGSFSNRDAVFLFIKHFQKERLVPEKTGSQSSHQTNHRSQLGEEILALTHDSAATLNSAARSLHRQGKQLDYALMTATDIKKELDISDKLIGAVESPFRLSLKGIVQAGSEAAQDTSQTTSRYKEINILFTKTFGAQSSKLQPGVLRICDADLRVISKEKKVWFQFEKTDDGTVRILAPWEFEICKRKMRCTDVVCNITTAQLVLIEPFLRKHFGKNMKYEERKENQKRKMPSTRESSNFGGLVINQAIVADAQGGVQQLAVEEVSQQDSQELARMISEMKTLALDLGQEQDAQMETIEAINTVVDDCGIQMKDEVRRIRKLI